MKVTIIAATGGIGRQLVEQAIAAAHDVTAVVRNPERLAGLKVRQVTADLSVAGSATLAALESAVAGADGVVSGLGQRSAADNGIARHGTQALIAAIRATDARRLVVVSAAPISTVPSPANPHPAPDPGENALMRYLLSPFAKTAFRRIYADLALMEDLVRDSKLDWTIVRPPRLTDGPLTGIYRTANGQSVRRGMSISRADVAQLMLACLQRPETIGQAVGVAY